MISYGYSCIFKMKLNLFQGHIQQLVNLYYKFTLVALYREKE